MWEEPETPEWEERQRQREIDERNGIGAGVNRLYDPFYRGEFSAFQRDFQPGHGITEEEYDKNYDEEIENVKKTIKDKLPSGLPFIL